MEAAHALPAFLQEQDEYEAEFLRSLGFDPESVDATEAAATVDSILAEMAAAVREIRENERIATRKKEIVDLWLEQQNGWRRRNVERLEGLAEQLLPHMNLHGKKSKTLANGKIGTRKIGQRLQIADPAAALAFSKGNDVPIKESPVLMELKEYWKSSGLVPDGCEKVEAYEKFYADPILEEGDEAA